MAVAREWGGVPIAERGGVGVRGAAGTVTARYWGESESGQCGYGNGVDAAALQEYRDGRLFPATTVMRRRRRWGHRAERLGGCTMYSATFGSGRRTVGTTGTPGHRPTGARGVRGGLLTSCVARRLLAQPTEAPPFGGPRLALGRKPGLLPRVPCRPDHRLIHTSLPLHLLYGGPGGKRPLVAVTRSSGYPWTEPAL